MASCVTAAPADLPTTPQLGPIIVQDAVQPSPSDYLTALPVQFIVPVRVFDPNKAIQAKVFVDFTPGTDNTGSATGRVLAFSQLPALDGGLTNLDFTFDPTLLGDPTACHTITLFVAYSFDANSDHTAGDSLGTDQTYWQYSPNGAGACLNFDAGDGAFLPDAPSDVLVVPDVVQAL
jgi:hypothetical protein